MPHSVPVLVPTLRGRTSAQLYRAEADAHARLGAVLVAMPGAWVTPVTRVYDELALYLRAAGIGVLSLSGSSVDATAHATELLGSVSLLQSLGASRVVLIAGGADGTAPLTDTPDAALAGLLDLITARASSPRAYAQLIAELVDTIRSAVDVVAGIARLVPCPVHPVSPADAAAVLTVALPSQGEPSGIVDAIAQLYSWAVPLLRSPEPASPAGDEPIADPAAGGSGEPPTGRVSQAIHHELERAWHDVVLGLERRAPRRAQRIHGLSARERQAGSATSIYGRAWIYLDQQARLDWIAACARVFPLRIA